MGKVYVDLDDHIVVELNPEDLLYRYLPIQDSRDMLSVRGVIKDLAWFILNSKPAGKKMVDGRTITCATTEVINNKFVVTFLPGVPIVPEAPKERTR